MTQTLDIPKLAQEKADQIAKKRPEIVSRATPEAAQKSSAAAKRGELNITRGPNGNFRIVDLGTKEVILDNFESREDAETTLLFFSCTDHSGKDLLDMWEAMGILPKR